MSLATIVTLSGTGVDRSQSWVQAQTKFLCMVVIDQVKVISRRSRMARPP